MRVSAFSYLSKLFSLSDEQAMLRVQRQNDPQAFALLVHRWEAWTKRFCTRLTGDVHRGEDLSQEVFMRIFARRHDYRHEASFGSYLRRVAFNACHDELRRMGKRPETQLNWANTGTSSDIGSANRNTVMWRIVGTVAPAYLRTT